MMIGNVEDICALDQLDEMSRWNHYLREKNRLLIQQGRPPIHCYCADTVGRHLLHGNESAVVITNQIPSTITNSNCQLFLLDLGSWYGGYYRPDCVQYLAVPIVKKFTCLMNRLEVHRQSFFYELIASRLIDEGHVSMLAALRSRNDNIALRRKAWTDMHHMYNSCFDSYLQSTVRMIPYRNFDNNLGEFHVMNASAYTVVMETSVDRSDSISLTEKTIWALQTPRPFLLMASKGTVAYVRQLGFDVFDDYIDHDYDNIDTDQNAMPRLIAIFDQLKQLCSRPLTKTMIDHWNAIHDKNLMLLAAMNQRFHNNFSVIDSAFDAAMGR